MGEGAVKKVPNLGKQADPAPIRFPNLGKKHVGLCNRLPTFGTFGLSSEA